MKTKLPTNEFVDVDLSAPLYSTTPWRKNRDFRPTSVPLGSLVPLLGDPLGRLKPLGAVLHHLGPQKGRSGPFATWWAQFDWPVAATVCRSGPRFLFHFFLVCGILNQKAKVGYFWPF